MAKQFSWSYSKLKNVDVCPKRYYEIDVAKNWREEEGEQLAWGNRVHLELAKSLVSGSPLPEEMQPYQKWVDQLRAGAGRLLVEQKYALTKDFQPCPYFGPTVWYRGICDALRINGDVGMAIDWKTGGIKHDATQLMLMAQCIFAVYPDVSEIETRFIWLQDDTMTRERYTRAGIAKEWVGLLPRVARLEEMTRNNDFPAKPGGMCFKWCPVQTCPFYKRGSR